MDLRLQKRIAKNFLKIGKTKILFKKKNLSEIKEATNRKKIKELIKKKIIIKKNFKEKNFFQRKKNNKNKFTRKILRKERIFQIRLLRKILKNFRIKRNIPFIETKRIYLDISERKIQTSKELNRILTTFK